MSELRSFLGLCGKYRYRRYIDNFACVSKCLHKLTENGSKYLWTQECQGAFQTLKTKLLEAQYSLIQVFQNLSYSKRMQVSLQLDQEIDGK